MKAKLNKKAIVDFVIKIAVAGLLIFGLLIAATSNEEGFYDGFNLVGAAMVIAGLCLAMLAERKKWISFPSNSNRA